MSRVMNDKITVVHVVLSLEIGGMESVIANIARNIDKDLFRLVVICVNKIGPLGRELQKEGIKVTLCKKMVSKISFLYPKALVRAIKNERADIIHSHSGCWHKAAIAGKYSKVKGIIYTEHGRLVPDCRTVIILDRIVSRITNIVVPVSIDLKNYLENVVKIQQNKLVLVENGIDTKVFLPKHKSEKLLKEFNIPKDSFVIGNIARLAPVKDHKTLLRAIKITKSTYPTIKLLIIGDGPESKNIQQIIKNLNLSDNVQLLGFRRDIRDFLSIMDIFVLSSISEGTSMTVLEAMAMARPIVATDVGGNSKLVTNNETGFLVPPKNPEALALKIIEILENKEMAKSMGLKGQQRICEHFNVKTMTTRYENLYLRLINRKNS